MSETGRVGCCSVCGGSGNGSYWDSRLGLVAAALGLLWLIGWLGNLRI